MDSFTRFVGLLVSSLYLGFFFLCTIFILFSESSKSGDLFLTIGIVIGAFGGLVGKYTNRSDSVNKTARSDSDQEQVDPPHSGFGAMKTDVKILFSVSALAALIGFISSFVVLIQLSSKLYSV